MLRVSSIQRVYESRAFRRVVMAFVFGAAVTVPQVSVAQSGSYTQTNLISDGAVPATRTDPNLINPWGLSIGPDFWIDSPGTGLSLVTDGSGNATFNVAIPAATPGAAHGVPSGTVFNPDPNNFITPSNGAAQFLFATLDGTIAAWNPTTPSAVTVANNSAAKASYTDIAIDKNATGSFLLAANFAAGTVDVFNTKFASTKLSGGFADPQMPAGFNPFGIHAVGSQIYVTYAQLDPTNGREVVGAGMGYVDVFDNNGNLVKRAISQGNLNAPWGLAVAPSGFGAFANDLLIGNFGDGKINAYDPTTFALLGTLMDSSGNAITNSGLWEIVFGTGPSGAGNLNTLYLAAGLNGEKDGVVAAINPSSATTGAPNFSFTSGATDLSVARGQSGNVALTLAGTNSFNGAVSFSCSGMPAGDTCTFSPATVTISGTSAATVQLTVGTAAVTNPVGPYGMNSFQSFPLMHHGVAFAFVGPLGLLALAGGRRRRSMLLRGTLLVVPLLVLAGAMTGCSSSAQQQAGTAPPPSTSSFLVTATSGSTSQSITMNLTVN